MERRRLWAQSDVYVDDEAASAMIRLADVQNAGRIDTNGHERSFADSGESASRRLMSRRLHTLSRLSTLQFRALYPYNGISAERPPYAKIRYLHVD